MSMVTYLNKIKTLHDTLAASNLEIDNIDVIHIVIDGIGMEYDPFVTSMNMLQTPSFDEIH